MKGKGKGDQCVYPRVVGEVTGGGHAVRTRKEDREGKAWKTREVEGREV